MTETKKRPHFTIVKGYFKRYHKQSVAIRLFLNEQLLSDQIIEYLSKHNCIILTKKINIDEILIKIRALDLESLEQTMKYLQDNHIFRIIDSLAWKYETIQTL